MPITSGDDVLTVVPATLDQASITRHLRDADAAVVMKLGDNLPKVRAALDELGLTARATYVERGSMQGEIVMPLAELPGGAQGSLFRHDHRRRKREGAMSGWLSVVGLGPGSARLVDAGSARGAGGRQPTLSDMPLYLDRIPPGPPGQTRHVSENRVELDRAYQALELARAGRRVAVVSSGDPGVFAMAAAVMEAVEADAALYAGLDIRISPGITAMQAAASRVGAPLGHDFCALSLSDNLKPWDLVLKRLEAAASRGICVGALQPGFRPPGHGNWGRRSIDCADSCGRGAGRLRARGRAHGRAHRHRNAA
jgi:precorrin-2 C20-methyltransferase/precorrin-3B C17-methyltransferase